MLLRENRVLALARDQSHTTQNSDFWLSICFPSCCEHLLLLAHSNLYRVITACHVPGLILPACCFLSSRFTMPGLSTGSSAALLLPPAICLPLQKYSFVTVDQNRVGPLPWQHVVSHGSLFVSFETNRIVEGVVSARDSRRFKILQDPNIMVCQPQCCPTSTRILIRDLSQENLDLAVLAAETKRAIDTARDASDHNRDHNVAVIKKVPVIAIKYPISQTQVTFYEILAFITHSIIRSSAFKSVSRAMPIFTRP
jgi:hypothetical protein